MIFFQGHASPGMYALGFLEGTNRNEFKQFSPRASEGGGLSSYPHPYLMPNFWQLLHFNGSRSNDGGLSS